MFRKKDYRKGLSEEDWWRLRRLKLTRTHEVLMGEIRVKAALTPPSLFEYWRLVYERYVEVGLLDKTASFWTTPYHFLPETRFFGTYIGEEGPESVAGIVFDGITGLPSDALYKDVLDDLRGKQKLAEIFSLASRKDMKARNTLFHLFRILYRYALFCGAEGLVIAIHPKHADFYERILLFERVGERRAHLQFQTSFTLEYLSLTEAPARYWRAYKNFPAEYNLYHFFKTKGLPEEKMFSYIRQTSINFLNFSFKDVNYFTNLSEIKKTAEA